MKTSLFVTACALVTLSACDEPPPTHAPAPTAGASAAPAGLGGAAGGEHAPAGAAGVPGGPVSPGPAPAGGTGPLAGAPAASGGAGEVAVTGGAGGLGGGAGGSPPLEWRRANLTFYESYPDPGSAECIEYNGCTWAGQFAAVDGVMPESWVMEHNIASVHSRDFANYRLKTLRLRSGTNEIDVVVYDMCSDTDCDGCCTENAAETGFLIDIEKYTAERFGVWDGVVEWVCLDC